jgi:glycosyltransferase involved in cell wall biosynthesis
LFARKIHAVAPRGFQLKIVCFLLALSPCTMSVGGTRIIMRHVDYPELEVEHLHGPKEIPYREDELVVVCLVRDGWPWVRSFVEHYLALGAKHIVFLDNGSTDGTVEALQKYDNVTVLRSQLPFKRYQGRFRRYLIGRFGKRDRWCLCVDIDELFDYPYSDLLGLDSLLGYLNSKSYTAVTAQTLDMFPERALAERTNEPDEPLKQVHRFYDISRLRIERMGAQPELHCGRNNTFEDDDIEFYWNGIRTAAFDVELPLTKFPLTLCDGKVRPNPGSVHRVDSARVADFSCVLFHYKFLKHFREQTVRAVQEQNYRNNSYQYRKYLSALEDKPGLVLKQETSREIVSVNDLLENGFVTASNDYIRWVNAEERRNVLQSTQDKPDEIVEGFLEARRQQREKTLRLGRVEAQLLKARQQDMANPPPRVQKLGSLLRGRDRRIQRLGRQLHERDQRLEKSMEKQRRLTKRLHRLQGQLEDIQASRAWRVLNMLRRIRTGGARLF